MAAIYPFLMTITRRDNIVWTLSHYQCSDVSKCRLEPLEWPNSRSLELGFSLLRWVQSLQSKIITVGLSLSWFTLCSRNIIFLLRKSKKILWQIDWSILIYTSWKRYATLGFDCDIMTKNASAIPNRMNHIILIRTSSASHPLWDISFSPTV